MAVLKGLSPSATWEDIEESDRVKVSKRETLPFLALLLPFCQRLMPLLAVLQRLSRLSGDFSVPDRQSATGSPHAADSKRDSSIAEYDDGEALPFACVSTAFLH